MHQFGLGVRLDSDNLVSILLNVGLNTHAMSGHSLDFTGRISTNPYAELHYAYNTPVFATLNASASVRYTDRSRFFSGTNKFNISFIQGTQDLYFSNMRWTRMDLRIGFENQFTKVTSIMAADVVGDYGQELQFRDYPGVFMEGRWETLDNGYFPTKGISAGFRADLRSRAFYPSEKPIFATIAADIMAPISVGRFSLIPQASLRFAIGDDIPIQYANIIGGDMRAQYADQQIPFVGVGNSAFRRNYLVVGRLDARMRMLKNHYVSLMGNVSYDFEEFRQILNGELIGGVGLGYAYNSVFGPLKFQVHWSTFTKTVGVYLALGYNF